MKSRRNFLKTSLTGITCVAMTASLPSSAITLIQSKFPIHIFTKCLQFLSYNEMAEVLARQGFYGADLTVRPGGQILPENVETDLPKAVRALRDVGLDTDMIVTGITNADDPLTRKILKTMANLGIGYYRTGYLNYSEKLTIPENLDIHKFTFENLEKVNREYGVHGAYQNHSGRRVGGPVWDLYHLLKDRDPEFIGVQYDIRHATVEGAISWPQGMKLLSPWIKTTAIKDFIWQKNEDKWILKNIPLGEGIVDFDTYFKLYKALKIEGPVSIHYEYDLGGAERGKRNPSMSRDEIFTSLLKDLNYFKGCLEKYDLY